MIRFFFFLLVLTSAASAYVPTVESLFRHGGNADVTSNGVSITMVVKKVVPGGEDQKQIKNEEYYKLFFTKVNSDTMKVAQTRYKDASYSEASLEHKIYFPNFTPYTLKSSVDQAEKALFFSLLNSISFNNGSHLMHYLKTLGVPVKMNGDLINREKIEYLASYKKYIATINQNRNARKTEVNPLRPEDPAARERVESVMDQSMYVDTNQVQLVKDDGEMAWMVTAGPFESVVSYRNRHVQKLRFKSAAGDLEIVCQEYWLANGSHYFPKTMLVRTFSGEDYQIEITNFRHYDEREDDLVKRLRKWDQILKGKESTTSRPEFLL